jgi:hypothetical protein
MVGDDKKKAITKFSLILKASLAPALVVAKAVQHSKYSFLYKFQYCVKCQYLKGKTLFLEG